MARVCILTDRAPRDKDWKGAFVWAMVRALADSQHDVTVLTNADLDAVDFTHPRLSLARPAPTYSVDRLPAWSRALLLWRPEVIHTFCLQKSALWPSLSVWPYLDAALRLAPDIKRVVSVFDRRDLDAAPAWYAGAARFTTFAEGDAEAVRARFGKPVEVCPLDDFPAAHFDFESADVTDEAASPAPAAAENERPYLIVPAPVSEWPEVARAESLKRLARHLEAHPDLEIWINGGWGELLLGERRAGWEILRPVTDRVRLSEPLSLGEFGARAAQAKGVYLDPLDPRSWRAQVARRYAVGPCGSAESGGSAERSGSAEPEGSADGESALAAAPARGPTANHFSRLYLL